MVTSNPFVLESPPIHYDGSAVALSVASMTDDELDHLIERVSQQYAERCQPIELGSYIKSLRGIETRTAVFDHAIETVLGSMQQLGTPLGQASEILIGNHPEHSTFIARSAVLSMLMTDKSCARIVSDTDSHPKYVGPLICTGGLRYELLEHCGSGSYGQTFKAVDFLLSDCHSVATVAVKLIDVIGLPDHRVEEVLGEAIRASAITHPNVIQVYDRGVQPDGWAYIAMEYVDGGTLDDWHPSTEHEFIDVCIRIANGLHAIHMTGAVHSDLKPANILVSIDQYGRCNPKIADFGVSRVLRRQSDTAEPSVTGRWYGNRAFRAPELERPDSVFTVSVDVYSLGAMMWYIATGHLVSRHKLTDSDLASGRPRLFKLSERMRKVIQRAMHPDPERRYQSAHEFAVDLSSVLERKPIAGLDSRLGYASLWVLRHKTAAAVLVGAAMLSPPAGIGYAVAREGWAYEQGKRDMAHKALSIDRMIRPSLSARDTVYDLVNGYMIREIVRDEDAMNWLHKPEADLQRRIRQIEASMHTRSLSPLDQLLLREQLIVHKLQDQGEHPDTIQLILTQRAQMTENNTLTESESDQLDVFYAIALTKQSVIAMNNKQNWRSPDLGSSLDLLVRFIDQYTNTKTGRLTDHARRDPRIRLAVRAAEWLSSPKMLNIKTIHDRLAREYLKE